MLRHSDGNDIGNCLAAALLNGTRMYSQDFPLMLAQLSQRLLDTARAIFRIANRTSDACDTYRRAGGECIEQIALLRLGEPHSDRLFLVAEHLERCCQRRSDDRNLARSEADFLTQPNCGTRNVPMLVGHAAVSELLPYCWVRFKGDDSPSKPRTTELDANSAAAWVNIEHNRNASTLEDVGDDTQLLLR